MNLSELRQDPISGDWIVIAARRNGRPHEIAPVRKRIPASLRTCPFERPDGEPILQFTNNKDWTVRVVENKFPAFTHPGVCSALFTKGIYTVTGGVGHHDVIVTRDHYADFPELSPRTASEVFQAMRDRYLMLAHDKCLAYVSMFHNWGATAGASVYHPHYQLIAIPVVPPDVMHSLEGSRRYFLREKKCVHCAMIAWEKKEKTRVIYENRDAIVVAPFVSRQSFEFRVFPKRHSPYFEEAVDGEIDHIVEALRVSLHMMRRALHDPDYNFFIHTAPFTQKKKHAHYHWHIEVLPKVNIAAGFELGTGIEINPVDPDEAAKILRGGVEK